MSGEPARLGVGFGAGFDDGVGPVFDASDIDAGYRGVPVVTGISITVGDGEIVSVLGPNGSGKSTLLKTVVGVIRPLAGKVLLHGRDITALASEEIARMGLAYVPQVEDVFEELTARENLEMGGYVLERHQVKDRIDVVVEQLPKLRDLLDRRAGKLSGGERKLLAIGRALMVDPRLLVLDEPTANLAPKVATELLEDHVRNVAAAGAGVLIVEQRVRSALAISDRTYVLGSGRCVMSGTARQVQDNPDFVASFLGGG